MESGGNTISPHPSFSFQNPLRFSTPPTTLHFPETSKRRGWFFFVPQVTPFLHPSFQLEIPTPDFLFLPFSAAKREKEKLLILITEEPSGMWLPFKRSQWIFFFASVRNDFPEKNKCEKMQISLQNSEPFLPSFLPCLLPSSLFVESRGKGGERWEYFREIFFFFRVREKGRRMVTKCENFFFSRERRVEVKGEWCRTFTKILLSSLKTFFSRKKKDFLCFPT